MNVQRIVAILMLAFISAAVCLAADSRPNVIVIFSDDQRYDTIHALGNDDIKTPALDSLVRDGVAFTNPKFPPPEDRKCLSS